jgi:phosphate/sulfate permease
MHGANQAVELATTLLHVLSGLYSAFEHVGANDPSGAIGIALVTALCVLILGCAVAIAEVTKMKVRRYMRKHELPAESSKPRDKNRDA